MALEVVATLIKKLAPVSGTSARGDWQKQEFIVETEGEYPKKICFNVWGEDKSAELANYNEGDSLRISFNIESREYNERWYTDLRAWRIEKVESTFQEAPQQPMGTVQPTGTAQPMGTVGEEELPSGGGEEDLPF